MMQLQSPGPRLLAVPGIGFPQGLSLGRHAFARSTSSRRSGAGVLKGHERRSDVVRTDYDDRLPAQLIACYAVAVITLAIIVGPLAAWLLSRAAVLAS
jgi:hypothetical protein